MTIETIKNKITPFLKKNGVEFAAIFGSYAKGSANEESDIDVLVRFAVPKDFFEYVRCERELAAAAGKKVDLVTEGAVSPYLKDKIIRESVLIYGAR